MLWIKIMRLSGNGSCMFITC